jgi:hypothetical protein
MYHVRIKKRDVHVDPWDLLNAGFLKAIPRLKLHIILKYTTQQNEKNRKREFHIASVSAEQIITDHLYQIGNNLSECAGVADNRILAGIDRHYVKGAIKLEREEVVRIVYNKYLPEKHSIIQQFRDNAPDYRFLIK